VILPAVPVYCRCTPAEQAAFLLEPGVVADQDPVRVAERGDHVVADVVADQVSVPPGRGEQSLHPVRGVLPGMLGQRPAGLPLQPRQHPGHAGPGTGTHLPPEETGRDQRERIIKPGRQPGPLNIVYPGQRGHPG